MDYEHSFSKTASSLDKQARAAQFSSFADTVEDQERFGAAIEIARMAVLELDGDTNVIKALHDANGILGFGPDFIPTYSDLVARAYPGEENRLISLLFNAIRRGDGLVDTDFRYSRGDGYGWYSLRAKWRLRPNGLKRTITATIIDITAQKTREIAVQKADLIKGAILESALDAIVTVDEKGIVVGWNAAAEQTFGYQREFAIGRDIHELIYPPEHREENRSALARILTSGKGAVLGRRLEIETVRADGSSFSCEMSIRTTTIDDELYATAFMRPVERKKKVTEKQLITNKQLYDLADLGSAIVWFASVDGTINHFNRRWYEFTGQKSGEALPLGWLNSVHPDDMASFLMSWSDGVENGVSYVTEVRLRRWDGEYRWYEMRGEPQVDEDGVVIGWLGNTTDIHERKLTEQRLREQHDQLWNLSQDLIGVYNLKGQLVAFNPAWTTILGYAEDDLENSSFSQYLVVEGAKRATVAPSLRVGDEGFSYGSDVISFEADVVGKNGETRMISWTVVPHEDLFYAVGRDVTLEREASDALQASEGALRQAQKMEAIGQLTGGIAHDFNNLLTGIVGGLSLLEARIKSGRTDDAQRFIDMAVNSAKRASSLTHRLLAFARRQSLDVTSSDINVLVQSMGEIITRTLGERIAMNFHLAPNAWPVMTDANQFENALLNLVINARDAMPGGGKLLIATHNISVLEEEADRPNGLKAGDYVMMSVSDSGAGMRPEEVERAFEPFFTTKPVGQGTGLGLSMVYGFVKQLGGHVRIESEVNLGTRVKLYLPRSVEAPLQEVEEAPIVAPAGDGHIVLLVEDEDIVRELVTETLEQRGYQVLVTASAEAALPIIESEQHIDLLLSDVGLPGMNGRQLAEVARQHRPSLPVIFATGYDHNAALYSGQLSDGMEIVSKPFSPNELAARVAAMIGLQGPETSTDDVLDEGRAAQ